MTLRQDVLWHDGKKFTSADVVYSIEAFQAAKNESLYYTEVQAISRATANGKYKVEIYFSSATNMSVDLLTFPIMPEHQFDSIGEALAKVANFKPIGTGPYKYKKFDATTQLTLNAYDDYYGEKAENKIVFQVLPNKKNFFNLLKASNLSLIVSTSAARKADISGEDVEVVDFPANEAEYLGFNFSQKDLAKKSVRKAIANGLDLQKIIDECYYGSGVINDDMYFPGYLNVDAMEDPYTYDETESVQLLKTAGYTDQDGDGYLEDKDGEPLVFTLLVNKNNKSRVQAAKYIDRFLKEIGVQITVNKVSWDEYVAALSAGDFDLYVGGMKLSGSEDPRAWLNSEGEYNYTGYANGKLDDLLDQMKSGLKISQLRSTYVEIRDILHDELPYYCLLYKTTGAIRSPALVGDVNPTYYDYYRGCETWYCQYEVTEEDTEE